MEIRIHRILQDALKSFAVLVICGFLYIGFLTAPVLDFLSIRQWSIIGFVVAIRGTDGFRTQFSARIEFVSPLLQWS
jgi:hypothetical protein